VTGGLSTRGYFKRHGTVFAEHGDKWSERVSKPVWRVLRVLMWAVVVTAWGGFMLWILGMMGFADFLGQL
jgi:hypothetical protein